MPAGKRPVGRPAGGAFRKRLPLLLLGVISLVAALWAGLILLGVKFPKPDNSFGFDHGIYFVLGFLGTVIGMERGVALGVALKDSRGWPYLSPIMAGAGSVWLILGLPEVVGKTLLVIGGAVLVAIFIAVQRIQSDWHNLVMGLGAVGWLVGAVIWLAGEPTVDVVPWLATFLVLTIVGERLELSRFAKPPQQAIYLLLGIVAVYLLGVVLNTAGAHDAGIRIAGIGLIGMALWGTRYDIARRTIKTSGATRYMAAALLAGYFWMAVAGITWLAAGAMSGYVGPDPSSYDLMLHAIFVGFVFSMIFAHAPVIVPAVLEVPLPFRMYFYGPLALLHAGLVIRVIGNLTDGVFIWRLGGVLNEVAILAFFVLAAATTIRAKRQIAQGQRVTMGKSRVAPKPGQ